MLLSRRRFLAAAGAAAGAGLVLAACGKDSEDTAAGGSGGSGGSTDSDATGGSTGNLVLVNFLPDGIMAAGQPQRLPIGLGNDQGLLTTGGPDQLTATVTDGDHAQVAEVTAQRHAEALPRPYWPVTLDLATAGVYTLTVDTGDGVATSAFSITEPSRIAIPKPGDRLIPVDTPTTADPRGVNPICTRQPACPLHEVTLTQALATGQPVAFIIATPAFCQVAACGPVLDVLLAQRAAFPTVQMVHAEVYTDTTIQTTTEAVQAYQLPFEPVLYLAGGDGVIRTRLDSIFDGAEVQAALAGLA